MKKFLKIIGIVLLVVIGLLIAAPFFLEAKIGDLIKANVNNNVNAHLDFKAANLSLIKSFPNAELALENVTLINRAPFEGDTLFAAKEIDLTLKVTELFKSTGQAIKINNLSVHEAKVNVIMNEAEVANYDIGKERSSNKPASDNSSNSFSFDLQSYQLSNATIVYHNQLTNSLLRLSDFQHSGTGDLSATISELNTHTEAFVTLELDSTNYLNKNKISLDALIGIDLATNTYTFKKNEALINQLPLVFDGFIKLNETSQNIAVSFKTPSSDFKNFLAIIPETYAQNIDKIQTTGDFMVEGEFTGTVDEEHIPKFNIAINSENASFKYPDLPKAVSKVFVDTKIINTTGVVDDTQVAVDRLSFNIDNDRFNMVAIIKELMGNAKVNAHVDGKMNLANIEKAYPIPADLNLKGILNGDITTAFDMASIKNKKYEHTKTSGKFSLNDFQYASENTPSPIKISTTELTFNSKTVTLNSLKGATGKTDFSVTGVINNLLGFMFNDEKIEGNFNMQSDTFALNDFMVEEAVAVSKTAKENKEATPLKEEKIKIPSFLDATINASANTVLYDNIALKNVKGDLRIKDEKAILNNMTSSIFNGKIDFNGEVSTRNNKPIFTMKLGMDQLQIGETFKALELFEVLAPAAAALNGKLNSNIVLSGSLEDNFTPDLNSLSGRVLTELSVTDIHSEKVKLLQSLSSKLDFIDLDKLDLNGFKTALNFENGVVKVKPFTLKYDDIEILVEGSHTFDYQLNYQVNVQVPVKYLGSEVNTLIAKIDDDSLADLTIPVIAKIGGEYSSPEVTTDLTGGIKNLTKELIEIQKQKLINNGTDRVKDLLGDIIKSNTPKKDSTSEQHSTEEDTPISEEVLSEDKKDTTQVKKDSIPSNGEIVKEKAKNMLGGLLGKKKDSTKR